MPIATWIYILCAGCMLVNVRSQDYHQTDDDGNDFEPFQNEGEILPGIMFDDMMRMFADILNAGTLKESLGEVCANVRPIIETFMEQPNGEYYNDPTVTDRPILDPFFEQPNGEYHNYPTVTGYPNVNIVNEDSGDIVNDILSSIDSLCENVQAAIDAGGNVDIHQEICDLLQLATPQFSEFEPEPYNNEFDNHATEHHEEHIYIRQGYRWLLNSLLLVTFDTQWSSPWRYYIASPRELIGDAFKMEWERGDMDCEQLSQEIMSESGMDFLDHAIRNAFYEALRYRFYRSVCNSTDIHYGYIPDEEEVFTTDVINTMIMELIKSPVITEENYCGILRDSFDAFDMDEKDVLMEILDAAKNKYYNIVVDGTQCTQFFNIFKDRDPKFEQAIANYTGMSGVGELCSTLLNTYWYSNNAELFDGNPEDIQHEYIDGLSRYGYYRSDEAVSHYKSILGISSRFLGNSPALSSLLNICTAFTDIHDEESEICETLSSIKGSYLKPFMDKCEKELNQRYNYDELMDKYTVQKPYSIIFNAFFLFTFNGPWDMYYRYEIISITQLLQESFELWPNYNTICQKVGESLDEPGITLIEKAITNSFKYFIRDRLPSLCTSEFEFTPSPDNTFVDGILADNILIDIMQFLLDFQDKATMCNSLPETMNETESTATDAKDAFLEVMKSEEICQQFLNIHQEKIYFLDSIYRFTGYTSVEEFCNILVGSYRLENPETNEAFFYDKYLNSPFDYNLDKGDIFTDVPYIDLLPVSVKLWHSATVRDGIRLLCNTFKENLDYYRSDKEICDTINSESRLFEEECEMNNWLTEEGHSGPDIINYFSWPWDVFERWLPHWFHEFSGFDNVFYMYFTWELDEPERLDLSQILSDILGFSNWDTYSTCDRFADIIVKTDEGMTAGQVIEEVLDYTLGHLSRIAPMLCLADHLPFPNNYDKEVDVTPTKTSGQEIWWPYNQTYWRHVHLGPVEGPLVGKIFAHLTGYDPIEDMCRFIRIADSVDTDALKNKALEAIAKVRSDAGYCKVFAEFIDEQLKETYEDTYGDVPNLEGMTGLDINSMCTEIIEAFDDTGDLSFDWNDVTEHFKYYFPDQWEPSFKGEVLPGVSFLEFVQLIGNVYNKPLRSGLQSTCHSLNLEAHENNFPFEYELCMLADNEDNYDRFKEYCNNQALDYHIYNDHEDTVYQFPGMYSFLTDWLRGFGHNDDDGTFDEGLYWRLNEDLNNEFGFDLSSAHDICYAIEDLHNNNSVSVEAIAHKFVKSILHFTVDHLPMICDASLKNNTLDTLPGLEWDPLEYLIQVDVHGLLVDILDFLGDFDGTICENVESLSVESIEAKLFSVISDQNTCVETLEFVNDLIPSFTVEEVVGFSSADELCALIVESFQTRSNDAIDISILVEIFKDSTDIEPTPDPTYVTRFVETIIQILARVYNADNMKSGLEMYCQILDQDGQIDYFGWEIEDICTQVKEDTFEFYDQCYKFVNPYWFGIDYFNPDDHWEDNNWEESWEESWEEDESWELPQEILLLYDFARGEFGLDISNPYTICEAGGEIITTPMPDLISIVHDGMSLVLTSFLRIRHDLVCSNDLFNSTEFSFELVEEMIAYLANYETFTALCDLLTQLAPPKQEKEDICVSDPNEDILKNIATTMVTTIMSIIDDRKVCSEFLGIGIKYYGEYVELATGYDNSADLCAMIVQAFTVSENQDYDPPVIPSDVVESFENFAFFNESGKLLPFLTFDEAVEFFGFLYNQPTVKSILGYLCQNYKYTLDMFEIPENITGYINEACDILEDESGIDRAVSVCESHLVPLMFGSEYPIGLRQPNMLHEIAKILLPLAGEKVTFDNRVIMTAAETLINSEMNLRDFANKLLDGLLPIGVQTIRDMCNDWGAIQDFLRPDWLFEPFTPYSSDDNYPPSLEEKRHQFKQENLNIDAIWQFVGALSGFKTSAGEFDCERLRSQTVETVSEDLKAKLWSYIEDADQCMLAIDTAMQFIRSLSGDEEGELIDLLPLVTGYSSTSELCQVFVDLVVVEDVEDCPQVCTEEYAPQCGTDGETYGNLCKLEAKACTNPGIEVQHEGECQQIKDCRMPCVKIYDPQCGTDGVMYGNICELEVAACKNPTIAVDPANGCQGEPQCNTVVDCAGECGGSARADCSGTCNGQAVRDCNGDCQGNAIVNDCGYCVNGNTGRKVNFGRDKCGDCISPLDSSYRLEVDCNGDCGGDADYDECGECVGGNTGKLRSLNDDRLDCNGECDGAWEYDECNVCGPRYDGDLGSIYKDCHETCHGPGSSKLAWARMNECGYCVGGATDRGNSYGQNECGVCGNDISSCAGCDGVANSKLVDDACGVCGGDGTTCVKVTAISPAVAPSGEERQFVIDGAGLNLQETGIMCEFIRDGKLIEVVGTPNGPQSLTCGSINLDPGLYDVTINVPETEAVTLAIYDKDMSLTMDPTEIDLEADLEMFSVTFLAAEISAFRDVKVFMERSPELTGLLFLEALSSEGESWLFPGNFADDNDAEIIFEVDEFPSRSMELKVFPMIGEFKLPTPQELGFAFTFWALPPRLENLVFNPNGAYILASFLPGVNYKVLDTCDDIFDDTTNLGNSPSCSWVGPRKLVIIVGTASNPDSLIDIGDTLMLKVDTLRAFGEDFSHTASGSLAISAPDDPILPVIKIQGNTEISTCGTLKLSARGSTGGGGREMNFQWSVCNGPAGFNLLTSSSTDSRNFIIDGSNLQVEQDYVLCLSVSNFLSTGPLDVVESEITVRRSSESRPEVNVIPQGVDVNNALVSKSFMLFADVKFTECFPPSEVDFEWSVNDENVALNLLTRMTPGLFVERNTLPGDQDLEFTLTVYKSSDRSNFVAKHITIITTYSDLIPIINKPTEFTIGRQNGDVVLDVSRSIDPDNVALEMRYRWRCLQVTENTACYITNGGGETFPSAEDSERDVLVLNPLDMLPDVSYELSVEVSKGNRRASISVMIITVNGSPPEVIIATNIRSKKSRIDRALQLNAVIISPDVEVDAITWESVSKEGFGYLDLYATNNQPTRAFDTGYTSMLNIAEGTLSPGFSYVFKVSACAADQCGEAVVNVETLSIVTSCVLSMEGGNSYTEIDLITFNVDNCATETSAYPLIFQMYRQLDNNGALEAITEAQTTPVFETIGKSAREGTSQNTFLVKVCNTHGSCSWFDITVDVTTRETLTPEEATELKETLVEALKLTQKYLGALVNLNVITEKEQTNNVRRRRKRSVTESTPSVLEQLELIENVLETTVLDYNNAQLLIDQLTAINMDDITFSDRGRLLQVINEIVKVFDNNEEEEAIPENSVTIILGITGTIGEDLIPEQLTLISEINSKLITSQVAELSLGSDAVETSSDHLTSSIQRVIPTGLFQTKSSANGASIDFGTEIANLYGAIWSCSSGDTCSGVVIHYEHYETEVDYFSDNIEDRTNRAADIVSISLHDPDSDDELDITGLTTPVTINMTVTRPAPSGKTYECVYWSSLNSAWMSDGISTLIQTTTLVSCLTNHLSLFTLMAVNPPPLTTSASDPTTNGVDKTTESPNAPKDGKGNGNLVPLIVGVLVGLVIIVLILVILVIILIKKSSKSSKVVPFREVEKATPRHHDMDKPVSQPTHHPTTHAPAAQPSAPPAIMPMSSQQPQVQVVGIPMALTQTTPSQVSEPPPMYPSTHIETNDPAYPPPPPAPVLYLPPSSVHNNGTLPDISA